MAGTGGDDQQLLSAAQTYLRWARNSLIIIGPEGDPGGPLEEIHMLENLLKDGDF